MTGAEVEVEAEQQQVDAVRYLAGRDFTHTEIASSLVLSVGQVRRVLAPRVEAKPKGLRPVGRPRALNGQQVVEAQRLRESGMSFADIGEQLGVNRETVRLALRRGSESPLDRSGMPEYQASSESTSPAGMDGGNGQSQAGWPPPLTGPVQWLWRPLRGGGRVRLRPVPLAGRIVEVDADGALYCDDCRQMFSVEQALRLNPREHRIGLARHPGALVVPLTDADHGTPWVESPWSAYQYRGAW